MFSLHESAVPSIMNEARRRATPRCLELLRREVYAAVFLIAIFTRIGALRLLLPVAHRLQFAFG